MTRRPLYVIGGRQREERGLSSDDRKPGWYGYGLGVILRVEPSGRVSTVKEFTSRPDAYARMNAADATGSLSKQPGTAPLPTESDLAFARTAASDVLTKGDKDSSQPWENPATGARGSVTPLSQAYSSEDGRTCRDFLASYVNGRAESWLQGAACKAGHGRWEIHTLKPWRRG